MRGLQRGVMLALALVLLAGCGGGTTAPSHELVAVRVQVTIPELTKQVSRVVPTAAQSVSLEVFNGNVRVAQTGYPGGPTTLMLPPGSLTFYANAYPDATAPDYKTDPTTGLPAAPANDPPLAHGVTVQAVPVPASVNGGVLKFTMNNTIVSLTPASNNPYTVLALNSGPVPLTTLGMTARDAQGSVLLLGSSALSWSVDTADSLAASKASISGAPGAQLLALNGTGLVNLIATDTQINATGPGSQAVAGTFPILIAPASAVIYTATVTAIPAYAKSVTFTDSYIPFSSLDTLPAPLPPVPVPATSPIVTSALSLQNNGRAQTVVATAWTNANGTGVQLGTATFAIPATSLTGPQAAMQPLQTNVTGFFITPISGFLPGTPPQLYQAVTGSTTSPISGTLQAELIVTGSTTSTGQKVDPTTLVWSSSLPALVQVSATGVVTSVATAFPNTPYNVTITATDPVTTRSGSTTVQIIANTASATIGVQ